jgi:hypothetical protein
VAFQWQARENDTCAGKRKSDRVTKLAKIQFHIYITPQISLLDKIWYIFDFETAMTFEKLPRQSFRTQRVVKSFLATCAHNVVYQVISLRSICHPNALMCFAHPQNWHLCEDFERNRTREYPGDYERLLGCKICSYNYCTWQNHNTDNTTNNSKLQPHFTLTSTRNQPQATLSLWRLLGIA